MSFGSQVLAGHRPQSTEAERLRDQGRDPRKFQGNTRAVLQLLTLISRHRLLSRWGPFLRAVNITIEAPAEPGGCHRRRQAILADKCAAPSSIFTKSGFCNPKSKYGSIFDSQSRKARFGAEALGQVVALRMLIGTPKSYRRILVTERVRRQRLELAI
jgi:hypothetical protein